MNKLKKISLLATLICAGIASSPVTMAGEASRLHNNNTHIDYAKVIHSHPIYETISYIDPVEECHMVKRERHHHHHSPKAPIILGSIIGGAIGNELGHKEKNKKVGVVVGSILGGAIASDLSHQHHRDHGKKHKRHKRVCHRVEHTRYRQEITGYNVSYRYHGRVYNTVTRFEPGHRLRIAVNIQAADH